MTKILQHILVAVALWVLLESVGSPVAQSTPSAPGVYVVVNSSADAPLNPLNATQCRTGPSNTTCTLRAAVMFANRNGGGTITLPALPPGGVYQLGIAPAAFDDSTGDLDITQDLSIVGGGATRTIIDGGQLDPVLSIYNVTMSLSGVTVQNGKATQGLYAGGIYARGAVTISNSIISGNSMGSQGSGGIFNDIGSLLLINTVVSGNAGDRGGGIHNDGDGTLTLVNSAVRGNFATGGNGGGIYNDFGTVILNNSTVSGNSTGGHGGGIHNRDRLILNNSTVSGNGAGGIGGGIYNYSASTTRLRSTTIAFNTASADYSGGGVYDPGNSVISLRNTIIANNILADATPLDCTGTISSEGYNLISNTLGCTIANDNATNLKGVSANLGSLAGNGGPTETHALLGSSPAIDAGNPAGCTDDVGTSLTTDQRGFRRPANGGVTGLRCDIGAYEWYRFGLNLPFVRR